ncbi:hypothetical protein BDR06DRAFT_965479, partial [Suillus hirtellus]
MSSKTSDYEHPKDEPCLYYTRAPGNRSSGMIYRFHKLVDAHLSESVHRKERNVHHDTRYYIGEFEGV